MKSESKRIIKNTGFLYGRLLIMMFVSLYTSRLVLEVLGVTDFGIYNVVGGVVVLLSFFTSSLTNAAQRYLNVGLANDNTKLANKYFSISIILFNIISLIVLIIGEIAGCWFVEHELNIPPNRETAAFWTFQFTLISVIISIIQIPYVSSIIANEKMGIYAFIGLFEAIGKLCMVFILLYIDVSDSLIAYSAIMTFILFLQFVIEYLYCKKSFHECKFKFYWDTEIIKEILSFISGNVYGCIAWALGNQGTNILLNIFFGPVVNASKAISVQVQSAVMRFIENLSTAVKPQIIKSYVSGDRDYLLTIVTNFSIYATVLFMCMAIPICFNTEYILSLWLKEVPEYSTVFVQLTMIDSLFVVLVNPFWLITNATGKIIRNQVYGRTLTLLIFPVSWIILKFINNPVIPFWIMIIANFLYWLYVVWDVHDQIGFPYILYANNILKKCVILVLPAILMCILEGKFITDNLTKLLVTTSSSIATMLILTYLFGLSKEQKKNLRIILHKKFNISNRE